MSTQLNKLDIDGPEHVRPTTGLNAPTTPSAPVRPREAVQSPVDEPSSSYAAMLKEAYDGDTAEVMAVVAQSRRTGEVRGEQHNTAAEALREKTAAERVLPIGPEAKFSESLKRLHHRNAVEGAAATEATKQKQKLSRKQLHDQLMVASSRMGASEVATHATWQSFMRLTLILSQQNWVRQRLAA